MLAGTMFEDFDTTPDELFFAFPFPRGSILATNVQLARVFSKLTGDPLDDDPKLSRLFCLVYIAPLNAARQRCCKYGEMKWIGETEVEEQPQPLPASS